MNKIINFHAVNDAVWFESVVLHLKKRYNMVSAKDVLDYYYNGKKLRKCCLITVDDGHLSSYKVIYPILKKYNIPAIFFVSPEIAKRDRACNFWFQELLTYDRAKLKDLFRGIYPKEHTNDMIEDDFVTSLDLATSQSLITKYQSLYSVKPQKPLNMTVEQIVEIDREGLVEIGAHTMLHPFLARETDVVSRHEITSSVSDLEEMLGRPILTFAYPNGRPLLDWGDREVEYLKQTSVKLAFSTHAQDFSKSDNVYGVPRYGLSSGSLPFVKLKLFLGRYYRIVHKLVK